MSLTVHDLRFSYGAHSVLSGVSFSLEEGRMCTVLGQNGAGKTTLFKCILGFLPSYTGSIRIGACEARDLAPRELAKQIAYIPQNHHQSFGYSVLDMVLMGTAHSLSLFSLPGEAQKRGAYAALDRLGILDLADKNIGRISGGEQQLVFIARALAQKAKLLIMDEPTASLDFGNQDRVMRLIKGLTQDGCSVLLSTHTPQHALWYADSVLALQNGQVLATGAPEAVISGALLQQLYGMNATLLETPDGKVIVPVKGPAAPTGVR